MLGQCFMVTPDSSLLKYLQKRETSLLSMPYRAYSLGHSRTVDALQFRALMSLTGYRPSQRCPFLTIKIVRA